MELVCPVDRSALSDDGAAGLNCERGHRYPVVEGIAVLLVPDRLPAIGVAEQSWKRACGDIPGDARAPDLYLESLGISEGERARAADLSRQGPAAVDAVVQVLVGATCGIAYKDAAGALSEYPVPALPLPEGHGRVLLDVGCNWGRWTIAAARKGYRAIGLDPQLGAVLAARRVAHQLGLEITFVCADARFLPFADGTVDTAFSYSVLQHFSRADCVTALCEIGRVLKSGGTSKVQMANALGLRSAYHIARRRFRAPSGFEVRYYTPGELRELFDQSIGNSRLAADCFLGLGLQATDREFVSRLARVVIGISEFAKSACGALPLLNLMADSVYVESMRA